MATVTRTPKSESAVVPYHLTVAQFLKMIDAGVFPEGAHVELLGGMLVDKMTKHDPHDFGVAQFSELLRGLLPGGWIVREEKSIVLGRSDRPEPDIVVARGGQGNYRAKAPRADDIALIVEVADSSYAKDRGVKWHLYARARIPVYALLNIPQGRIEVYTNPAGRGKSAAYRDVSVHERDAAAPIMIEGRELGRIIVRDLLP